MTQPLVALLRRRYFAIAKDLLGPLVDVLHLGREACGGDLDKLLIVLVVALRSAEDRRIADIDLDEVLAGRVARFPSLSTNVRSIADSTGIPKETVRRKVASLIEDGWIVRDGHDLAISPHASRMLTAVREPILQMAVRNHQTVAALTPPDAEA